MPLALHAARRAAIPAALSAAFALPGAAAAAPDDFSDIVEAQTPTVVGIVAEKAAGSMPARRRAMPPGLREFFGGPGGPGGGEGGGPSPRGPGGGAAPRALGSGFLISADGHVVTNNHVVANAESIEVAFEDGTTRGARVIGTDPATDIALIDVEGEDHPHAAWGDSDALEIGDWTIAIGQPFGLTGTVTVGVLSARARDIKAGPYGEFLQTDASINTGNSGGPLFDANGEVIGVNTAILSPSGGNVGIGFAVPSAIAEEVVAELRANGSVERGFLGVSLQAVDEGIARALDLDEPRGALVAEVRPEGPAAEAGLEPGDVIVAFRGEPVEGPDALAERVAELKPGEEVGLTLVREGERRFLDFALGTRPTPESANAGEGPEGGEAGEATLGVRVAELSERLRERIGAPEGLEGVVIAGIRPGSPAAQAALRRGDVVVRAGKTEVEDVGDLREATRAAAEAEETLLLRVWRRGRYAYVSVPVGSA